MNIEVTIRQAIPADAEWLTSCTDEAYGVYVAMLGRKPLPMTMDYLAAIDEFDVWIAEHEGSNVGLLVLQHEHDHTVIYSIAVLPASSGQGIGKSLLSHAERVALTRGFKLLRLYTNERMERNLALYRSVGYINSHLTEYKGQNVIHLMKLLAE